MDKQLAVYAQNALSRTLVDDSTGEPKPKS